MARLSASFVGTKLRLRVTPALAKGFERQIATLITSKLVEGKAGRVVLSPALKKYRKNLETTATTHYRNLGGWVRIYLNGPTRFQGPDQYGSRQLRVMDGEGQPVVINTELWPKLSRAYARSSPVSRRMWKKRGALARHASGDLPRSRLKASIIRRRVVKTPRKDRVRAIHILGFTATKNATLTEFITRPFVHGKENASALSNLASSLNRDSSDVLFFPEAAAVIGRRRVKKGKQGPFSRPWVARLSGRLGSEMHRAIRKL